MHPNYNNNGPCFELFNAAADVTKFWKIKGKYNKEFEPHSKSYIYYLYFGGVSMLSTPINEKQSLQINNNSLLFQFILYNTKSFSIEICVKDKTDTKRRFNLTTSVKEVEPKSLYIKIPFIEYPINIWTNLIIDLSSLTQYYFKTQSLKVIDSIHITGNLKIRKIFSLRTKDEPVLKSVEMGKSIPIVNLFFTETGNMINKDLKIVGSVNPRINTVNIDSKSIQNNNNNKSSNSPPPNNKSKYSTTSDIMLNRHKQFYRKNKEQNPPNNMNINNNSNNINEGLNITPAIKKKFNEQKDIIGGKIKDTKLFIKNLPQAENIAYNIKYKSGKTNYHKLIGNLSNEEGNASITNIVNNNTSNNNTSNLMNNNYVEKRKSLGKYMQNQHNNKKRNKSNNPLIRNKISQNKKNENSEHSGNINTIKEEKLDKKINANINKSNQEKEVKNKITTNKKYEHNNIKDKGEINSAYYLSKEKEISLDDYSPNTNEENKFKFNSIPLTNSLVNKGTLKEEEKESSQKKDKNNDPKQNKFSNYNMLIDSGIDIKNIPIYDSIEEVADFQGVDLNNNNAQGEGVGDKLIPLDKIKKVEKNDINIDIDDILDNSPFEKKGTYRPYTPPIEELVQVNPNKMRGDSNMKVSLDKKNSLLNATKTLKNYENLIYNEEKGLLYDPITNKYYDIKEK